MKIFITGVAGFIGSHLADRLLKEGHEIHGNDNLFCGKIDNVHKDVKFYDIDCCNLERLQKVMSGSDIVIHTAALAHESLSLLSPCIITKHVYEASVKTITAALNNKVKRFIYFSSIARYGNAEPPFYEIGSPTPSDPYGIAKVAGEQILQCLSKVHKMDWNIVVPHNVYGPRQKYDDPYRNVVSIMINRNLQNLPSIIYGDGNNKRCFTYIDDAIEMILDITLNESLKGEIINIAPHSQMTSIRDLATIVAEECKIKDEPIFFDSRPEEASEPYSFKSNKVISKKEIIDLKEGVKRTADYIRSCGVKDFIYSLDIEILNENSPKPWVNKLL
jgi:UDP-glucose 4-epimerase